MMLPPPPPLLLPPLPSGAPLPVPNTFTANDWVRAGVDRALGYARLQSS